MQIVTIVYYIVKYIVRKMSVLRCTKEYLPRINFSYFKMMCFIHNLHFKYV